MSLLLAASAGAQQTTPGSASSTSSSSGNGNNDPAASGQEEQRLPELTVVGSRIRRTDVETVSPTVRIQADDLLGIGYPTLGDALRALPFNNGQALTPTDSGNSFTPGISTINLRGLGNNQTLVLINGRRAVPYATPGFNGFQTMFDFNSLPQAAIDNIEILKDGGSAIYGSDAVAGVVNINLVKDYQGLTTTFEVGDYFDTGGLLKRGSLLVGSSRDRTSIVATASYEQQDGVFARDLSYSRDADKTSVAHEANGRYTATGWEKAGFATEQEYLEAVEATDAIGDGWFDNRSTRGFPGYLTVPGDVGQQTFSEPTDTPTVEGAVPGFNPYNFQETSGIFPEYRSFSFFTSLRHDFTDSLYGFAEVSFTRYETESDAAATPVDIEVEHGLDSGSAMIMPDFNPFNPWQVDIDNGRRRLVELPNRINDVTADTPRLLAGLGGDLPSSGAFSDWRWEAAALYSKNSVTNLNRGSVSDERMQQALFGLTRLGDGSLDWDPSTPLDERVYFNWFGLNEPAMADFIAIENPTSDAIEFWNYDVSANGHLFQLPAGPLSLAVGAEHRQERIRSVRTDLNATGGIVGGAEGTSSFGDRRVTSFYAEAGVPVIDQIELQLAARYEDYSDAGFKDEARPKVGIKIRPFSWLILRGSYSQSFKAPDLAFLFTAAQTSFTSFQVADPVTGTQIDQIQIVTAGNRNLQPEVTDNYFAGVVFEAPQDSFLRGFELSIDYLELDQENLLAQLSDFYGYAEFLQENASGNPIFAGKVVRDSNTNEVLFIRDDYVNISQRRYRGLDMAVQYRWRTERYGDFLAGLQATKLISDKLDEDQLVGTYLTPRWNANANFSWDYGDWGVNLYGIYRGNRRRDLSFGTILDQGDELFLTYDMKAQKTLNASVTYRGLERTEVMLGVNNVFNDDPPVDPFDQNGSTPGLNDLYPAFWYVRVTRAF